RADGGDVLGWSGSLVARIGELARVALRAAGELSWRRSSGRRRRRRQRTPVPEPVEVVVTHREGVDVVLSCPGWRRLQAERGLVDEQRVVAAAHRLENVCGVLTCARLQEHRAAGLAAAGRTLRSFGHREVDARVELHIE